MLLMGREIIINKLSTSKASAVVQDAVNLRPVPLRDFVFGDIESVSIKIADGVGAIDSISGSASYTLDVALGYPYAVPTGGTFTLTFGGNTTTALSYDATGAQVQAALEALASIGSGNVAVIKGTSGVYQITFQGTKANTDVATITTTATSLTPQSAATVTVAQEGGGGNNEIQILRLVRYPVAVQTSWTAGGDGTQWTGTLNLNTFRALEELNGATALNDLIFTVRLTSGSTNKETYCAQANVTLLNDGSYDGALVPLAATYATGDGYTLAMLQNIFVQFGTNPAGMNPIFTSPDGTRHREIGVNNTGSALDLLS